MTTIPLPHRLERSVAIPAARDRVFEFFTDSARWASWWGAGSTIDARPGGAVWIRYPNGVEVSGEVVEIQAPERIVFTYGYASGNPIPAGASRVAIRLDPSDRGTRLTLLHEFADAAPRDEHVQGWRYQLSVFANVVSDALNAGAPALVDAWFSLWTEIDPVARERSLREIAAPDVRFRDRFSLVDGIADLSPHITAFQRFMPGHRLERKGDVRQCQGTVLADWVALGPEGQTVASGTNVFLLDLSGRIQSVTGFWTR